MNKQENPRSKKERIIFRKEDNSKPNWEKPLRVQITIQGEFRHLFMAMVHHDRKMPAKWIAAALKRDVVCFLESKEHEARIESMKVQELSPTSATVG